jgi:endonuclease/exonuclease/phosphatase family metal-dependent hydrolase
MRLATFNMESLDLPPKAKVPLEQRAKVLRPALERLDADILCLQEVNAQRVPGREQRSLLALDQLLAGTRYAHYARATTTAGKDDTVADVHNLVTLSRFPIRQHRGLLHDLVPPPQYRLTTAIPPAADIQPIKFDRPILFTEVELPGGRPLAVINVHLRAPLAVSVPGQKLEPFVWKSVGGWAEGYLLSAIRRATQALEIRMMLEALLDADKHPLIAIAGDFNAEDHEVPLRIILGAEEDTGNPALSARSLVLLERSLPRDRRWSVLHHGRPQMLDHIAVSHALHQHFRAIDVHNEALGDELVGYAKHLQSASSYHAPVVAEFADAVL